MQITVSGKQVDVGDSLRSHIEGRLTDGIAKYLERVVSVHVVVSKQGHNFRVDINGNTGTHAGIIIKSHAEGADAYAAFESAADNIEKQLRRYKRRITNHHKTNTHAVAREELRPSQAKKYVLHDLGDSHETEYADDAPMVIAEKAMDVEKLTVSEAVMKMDLADLPALMFINSAHGRVNVVYRRKDGNISWVDPVENLAA